MRHKKLFNKINANENLRKRFRSSSCLSVLKSNVTGLQINLYLEQPMEIQLFATFFQRRK
jgi:hypothetical protein